MGIEDFEKREQLLKLKLKFALAEQSRLSEESTVSLEDAKKRLEEKYRKSGLIMRDFEDIVD